MPLCSKHLSKLLELSFVWAKYYFGWLDADLVARGQGNIERIGICYALLSTASWFALQGKEDGRRYVSCREGLFSKVSNFELYKACLRQF